MSEKNLIEIGKIVTIHGVKGEVKVQPWCDYPEFFLEVENIYYKDKSLVDIVNIRVQKNMIIIKLNGIDTVEQAVAFRNKILYINKDEIELEEGCYFIQDLIGLIVKNAENDFVYGKIVDVSQTGANDVYHIQADDKKMYYIPAIPQVVQETNIEKGYLSIIPLKGLFDDED